MIQLRDYQEQLVADIRTALASSRRVLAVAPTGAGKTVTFSYIASQTRRRGKRIGIFAHRVELLRQISNTLKLFDVPHGIIAAGSTFIPGMQVYVCAAQTYAKRVGTARAPVFDVGIIDEAHHATQGSTWAACMMASPDAYWLGVTATPERLDGRGLGETFDQMVLGPTTRQLIERGALSRYRLFAPDTVDLSSVHTLGGDYNRGELADAVDKPSVTGDAVRWYSEQLKGAPSVAFCVSVAHAEHVAEEYRARGYTATSVDGKMDMAQRTQRIRDFSEGRINVLTSCDIVSEGFDVPGIVGAILLRPTQSLALYLQQVGRSLRVADGKDCAIILDHAGNCLKHGLPDQDREWSLDAAARKRGPAKEPAAKQCERCFQAMPPWVRTCPGCGWSAAPSPREVEQRDGNLAEVDRDAVLAAAPVIARQQQGRAKSLADLMALGHSESRARHILAAREEKEQLRNQVVSLARQAGVSIPRGELLAMKPKALRQTIERLNER